MENNLYYTNKVNFNINKSKLLVDYDLIELKLSKDMNKSDYSKLWTSLKSNISVLAYYKNISFIYLLTIKNEIKKIDINECDILKKFCFSKLMDLQSINKIDENILLNLLISFYGTSNNMFSLGDFQNGCFLISKIEKSKVVTLKFFVDNNSLLNMNVNTFSKINCTKFNKTKYVFYIIEDNKLIRVINPSESKDDLFIKKNKFKKSSIPFMEFTDNFLKSKVGYLSLFVRNLNISMRDYLQFNLEQKNFCVYNTGADKKEKVAELKKNIHNGFSKYKKINLIDFEKNLDSRFKTELLNKFKVFFNNSIKVEFVNDIENAIPSYIFIFSKDKYKDYDPYNSIKKQNNLSQILNYENHKKLLQDSVFNAILKELLIKVEIIKEDFYLTNKWVFFKKFDFFINVSSNNSLTFKKITFIDNKICMTDLSLWDDLKLIKIKEVDIKNIDIELIGIKKDEYFIIQRSKEFSLPNLDKCLDIYNDFIDKNQKPSLRLVKYRKNTVYYSLGINYIKYDNYIEYYSTTNNTKNPNQIQSKSNLIRKIYFSNKDFDYHEVLNSLDEYFIRNNTFTVLPFVYKYFNEFIRIKNKD